MTSLIVHMLSFVMWWGVLVGPVVFLGAAVYFSRREKSWFATRRKLANLVGLICSLAGVITLWAAFLYQRQYGFDFNDPTRRLEFVHLGSPLATCGMLIGLLGEKQMRSFVLVACALTQLYWLILVEQI